MGLGKVLAIVGGVLVGGFAAYNFSSTGCVLGMGCDTKATAATTTVSAGGGSECGLCPSGAAVQTVAETKTAGVDCCVADAMGVKDCDPTDCDKPVCCKGGAEVTQVAAEQCAEKTECAKSCEAKAECEEKAECAKSCEAETARND